tara:strand:+ start:534 stop:1112 length:579 start_codon:yes stop_codon:yes gene_type:complete
MNVKEVDINILIEAEYNPRQLTDKQYHDIKKSIKNFGFVEPLVVNANPKRKNILIGGHQRLRVAKDLNYKTVPIYEVNLSAKKEKELNIRLNANVGDWDWDKIANEWNYDEIAEWGLNVPVSDFSNELLDYTDEQQDELLKEENSSTIEIALSPENKQRVLLVLKQIKKDHETESVEEALIILCSYYKKESL